MVTVVPMMLLIYVPYFMFMFSAVGLDKHSVYEYSNILPYIPVLIIYAIVIFIAIFIVQAIVLGITVHFFQVLKKVDNEETSDLDGYLNIVRNNFKKTVAIVFG
jgi:hypothetical protein